MILVMNKNYDEESLIDLEMAIWDYIAAANIPTDENGFSLGTYKVRIEWFPEDSCD
jgi:hypothetical protein